MARASHLRLPGASARIQAERRFLWNDSRSADQADFFTIGYMGRAATDVLTALRIAGVSTLMDIRQNPVSMYRPELSKTNLRHLVEAAGIEYLHCPELGVPREIRVKAISAGTRDVIWEWYDEYVVKPYVGSNLHRFLNSAEHPVALMCVELDPGECHRHRLFYALEAQGLHGFEL